jgi:exonuclease SbcD
VDYTALGHLHGPRSLTPTVRYSGSPLAYSFSEATQTKGSWLVDLDAQGVGRAELVPAPVPRRLATVRGRLEDLLADRSLTGCEDAWLQATLTDTRRPAQAMERLRSRFPHALVLGFDPEGATAPRLPVAPHVDGRSDLDVALGFVAEVRALEATTEEELLLQLACDACRINDDREADFRVEQGDLRAVASGEEAS